MFKFDECIVCVPPKRHPGCQDTCPEHQARRIIYDGLKAAADKKKAVANSIYKQKSDGVNRALKKHPR